MNKILLSILINLFLINIVFCQTTKITYKSGLYGKDMSSLRISSEKAKELPPEQLKMIEEFFKSQESVEFELLYDSKNAIYRKVNSLNTDDSELNKLKNLLNSKVYYKNNETKEKLFQTEQGKLYNVVVPFEEYKWTITTETKIINGYKCYKATSIKEDIYNPIKKSKAIFYPVVWFTPDIPGSFGPQGLDGLPGVVLEASMGGKKYFYATKIEFDLKDATIERPKGENITEKDLENILVENYKRREEE